jgi:hypothetical protein
VRPSLCSGLCDLMRGVCVESGLTSFSSLSLPLARLCAALRWTSTRQTSASGWSSERSLPRSRCVFLLIRVCVIVSFCRGLDCALGCLSGLVVWMSNSTEVCLTQFAALFSYSSRVACVSLIRALPSTFPSILSRLQREQMRHVRVQSLVTALSVHGNTTALGF